MVQGFWDGLKMEAGLRLRFEFFKHPTAENYGQTSS